MLIRKMSAPQILLIGDTIINHTYLARPAHYTAPYGVPTAFFNEELLEVVNTKPNRPLYSVSYQGIGYIASYLSQALTSGVFYVWTGVGDSPRIDRDSRNYGAAVSARILRLPDRWETVTCRDPDSA